MPTICHRKLRRLFEAAERDRTPARFFDELSEGLRKGELKPADFSIRQLFENFVPDGRELVESWDPRRQGGYQPLMEAGGDSVNTAMFSNITGQIVYREVLTGFQNEAFVFTGIIPTRSTQFNGEKIPGITGLGNETDTVEEGKEYPTAGVGEDWIETPQTTKGGVIVPVTKEAIFFDRTGMLLDHANQVGYARGINKEIRIIDCVIDENVTAHRYKWKGTTYATYQTSTPYNNTTASATLLDWTDVDEAEQTLAAITDPHTGLPILNVPTHIIVTRQNLNVAKRIISATEIRTATPGYATSANPNETAWRNPISNYSILSSQLLAARMATDTTWYLGNPAQAFRYMENWPITVVQAPANSEAEFTRDIVARYKVSERGATATIEPRKMTKCTVA